MKIVIDVPDSYQRALSKPDVSLRLEVGGVFGNVTPVTVLGALRRWTDGRYSVERVEAL